MADARGYGDLKAAVGDAVVAELAPLQERYRELRADEQALEDVLAAGAGEGPGDRGDDARRRARGDGRRAAAASARSRVGPCHAQSRPRPAAALRLRHRGDRLGGDRRALRGHRARPQRRRRSRSPATTTRSSCSTACEPGSTLPYEVALDGARAGRRRTTPIRPASSAPTRTTSSCAWRSAPAASRCRTPKPYVLSKDDDPRGREVDALLAFVERMRHEPPRGVARRAAAARRPGLRRRGLAGDEGVHRRRGAARDGPPPDEVGDFEEYTSLYRESWSDPALRWLLSTVSSAMIFDDHDVHDDWNISEAWIAQMRAKPWWEERVLGAYMSYWIYQHLGNLSPAGAVRRPDLLRRAGRRGRLRGARARLRAHAVREIAGARWSYCRDFGRTRLVVVDSRAGRVLAEGERQMLSDAEWDWVEDRCTGDFDHLIIGTSLPVMLAPGMHHLEAWNEAVCDGAWGGLAARAGEKLRQALDLEHWAAFQHCFARLAVLLEDVAAGRQGPAPGDDRAALRRRAPRLRRRGVVSRPGGAEPRPAGDLLADPQPARQARAAGAALGVHAARWPPSRGDGARGGRRRPRRCAGRSRRSRRSTTRSPAWTCAAARRSCASRRRCREDWQAPRLHSSLALGIVPKA